LSAAEILTSDEWEWTEPVNLGADVNTAAHEFDPALTADGLRLVFMSYRDGTGTWLYEVRRDSTGEPFGDVRRLDELGGGDDRVRQPYLTADGLTVVFVSNRPGGAGEQDLWISHRASRDDLWGTPTNLGPAVNGEQDDVSPALSPDGLKLYHTRWIGPVKRHNLRFIERSGPGEPWGHMEPFGPGVNSEHEEKCPRPLLDGRGFVFQRGSGQADSKGWLLATPAGDGWDVQPILSGFGYNNPTFTADGRDVVFHADLHGGLGKADLWQIRRVPKSQ
jgi:Tol biopolymer transport system component